MDEAETTTLSPALSHIIERPRLTDRLRESGARVILLAAPAGYGKTTLARQWSARQTGPVVWHRTTRASGDVAALAVHLDTALDAAVPQPTRNPRRIASIASVNPSPAPLSRALVSTYGALTDELLLVVDEWEAAGTPESDELLGTLVEELKIRFLITTRTRPPWFPSRLKVYGEALEIGMDELTMTDEEAAAVIKGVPERESLLATAQGWPAVVGLAAMMADRGVDPSRRLGAALADFLVGELIASAPQDLQEAVMLVAAAAARDRGVVEILLGREARSFLERAASRGLVLSHEAGEVFIHPLLKDVLVARLNLLDRSRRAAVLRRAEGLIRARKWDEALAITEATADARLASKTLGAGLDDLLRSGRLETLRRLADIARTSGAPRSLIDYAESELAWRAADFDRAMALAARAARALETDWAARAHVVAARAAYLAGRHAKTHAHAQAAHALAGRPSTRASALWVSFVDAAEEERSDALSVLRAFEAAAEHSAEQAIRKAQGSLILGLLDGNLEEPIDAAEVARTLLTTDIDPLAQTSFLDKCADALCAAGRYEEALEAVLQEDNLATEYGLQFSRRYLLVHKSRALIGLRRFGLAERALSELARDLRMTPDVYLATYAATAQSALYISIGDLKRAAASLVVDTNKRISKVLRGTHAAMQAIIFASVGETGVAKAKLDLARETSRSAEVQTLAAIASAIAALRERRRQDATAIVDHIMDASSLLDPLVLGFRAFPELLTHTASAPRRRDLLTTLLYRSRDEALARQVGLVVPRSTLRSHALSPRELEIHGLIAQGMTNSEIARLLFISESTAKVHVRHILEKLGARSRVEAARIWQVPEG